MIDLTTQHLELHKPDGSTVAAELVLPSGAIRAYAVLAHCFSSNSRLPVVKLAGALVQTGIAVLSFDITGTPQDRGKFGIRCLTPETSGIISAVEYLRVNYQAPALLIGHSLAGAAALALIAELADIAAVAVIGTPSDVRVLHGEKVALLEAVALIRTPLLILHSPEDEVVDISHATKIFAAARHPKSYVSLGNADHFFTSNNDASSVGRMISSWSSQFLEREYPMEGHTSKDATARETGQGKYQTLIQSGKHRFVADEPVTVGGMDSGPSPYDLISAALGSCTAMTIRQYADFKNFQLGRVTVRVGHSKLLAQDCAECTAAERAAGGRIDLFRREIWVEGEINEELRLKIVAIADKCPVHRTLERAAVVVTKFVEAAAA